MVRWGGVGSGGDEGEENFGSEQCPAASLSEEGLRGVKGGEGGARKEGKVTAGQTNTH